ncbi:hypothetical protein L2E82_46945 [Cichorium intybus]|uniref:Uncharacterized protein n=1 Tax=Cichorium intybus TaxID=13427 RepID=A0ACB8YU02_CICIN|nr:hypothetical protein L2E82_46945 [Cichorium intybus]
MSTVLATAANGAARKGRVGDKGRQWLGKCGCQWWCVMEAELVVSSCRQWLAIVCNGGENRWEISRWQRRRKQLWGKVLLAISSASLELEAKEGERHRRS